MRDDGEFRVALSFAQMAAILTQESLSPAEIMSSRIFGSLRLVGGIVELAGSGVLCAIPEPTMISKVGCVAMGVHASDQLSAGMTQLVTGKETDSFSFKAGASVAESLGASRATGQVIGLATEFAVPLSTASMYNAYRVSSVKAGKLTVVVNEKPANIKSVGGGHIVARHVEKDIIFLRRRFNSKKVHVSSTFYDLATAEWAVSQALMKNKLKILMYSKAKLLLKHNQYVFDVPLGRTIGWGITREAQDRIIYMQKVKVVIKFEEFNHMPYYIITAHPCL
ncbi:RNase A-like domain-containing protein [Pseudomonas viridiflava]|uniref:RNase A-like domain-containing protein n=1 Tax=Pseudomonas viridiflava TaxID=33069 RepID=UPI000F0229C5|nr:RNase A-like domain-containing protein [Pseudomonas viridiflava]